MSEQELTCWFSPVLKPVRNGIYEVSPYQTESLPKLFQNWNGRFWGKIHYTTEDAACDAHIKSEYKDLLWRGLASDPNA